MEPTNHVINALPLIASVLGRKYGVRVHIGGERAYTNGRDIHLPALPLDSDETVLNVARGFLDHEAAHLRITDFTALKGASLSALEKRVWNILEDFMVERKLGEMYPGCARNFHWLIKHVFLEADDTQDEPRNSAVDIFNWLLLSVRAFAVPELSAQVEALAAKIDENYPELLPALSPLVREVPVVCVNTESCIQQARKMMTVIQQYADDHQEAPDVKQRENKQQKNAAEPAEQEDSSRSQNKSQSANDNGEAEEPTSNTTGDEGVPQTLQEFLHEPQAMKSMDFGEKLENLLQDFAGQSENRLAVAIIGENKCSAFTQEEINEIRRSTTGLRARLQGLLQAHNPMRSRIGRSGRIDNRLMARLTVNDPRIFMRRGERQGINTAIHILLDASYSMAGERINLACKSCYAVASALESVSGVSVAVTAFPAGMVFTDSGDALLEETLWPLLGPKQRLHPNFNYEANGGTPLAEALWWVMQQLQIRPENRKILLILSDGLPDNMQTAKNIIGLHQKHGHEVYGIGIVTEAMKLLLPKQCCRGLYNLEELASAMFDLLRRSLVGKGGEGNENAA